MGNFQLALIIINILQIRETQAQERNHLFMGVVHVRKQIRAVPWATPDSLASSTGASGAAELHTDLLRMRGGCLFRINFNYFCVFKEETLSQIWESKLSLLVDVPLDQLWLVCSQIQVTCRMYAFSFPIRPSCCGLRP